MRYKQQPCHKDKYPYLSLKLNSYRRIQGCHKNLRVTILSNLNLKNYKNVTADFIWQAEGVGFKGLKLPTTVGFLRAVEIG